MHIASVLRHQLVDLHTGAFIYPYQLSLNTLNDQLCRRGRGEWTFLFGTFFYRIKNYKGANFQKF